MRSALEIAFRTKMRQFCEQMQMLVAVERWEEGDQKSKGTFLGHSMFLEFMWWQNESAFKEELLSQGGTSWSSYSGVFLTKDCWGWWQLVRTCWFGTLHWESHDPFDVAKNISTYWQQKCTQSKLIQEYEYIPFSEFLLLIIALLQFRNFNLSFHSCYSLTTCWLGRTSFNNFSLEAILLRYVCTLCVHTQ